MTDRLATIRERVHAGTRLSFDDGVYLDRHADLHTLGELANVVRERKNGSVTYYNVNEHLNPTNVCVYRCTFCAFRADLKSPKGYVMSDEQILHRAAEAESRGATELHIVEMKSPVVDALARYGLTDRFPPDRFVPTVGAAVDELTGTLRSDIGGTKWDAAPESTRQGPGDELPGPAKG